MSSTAADPIDEILEDERDTLPAPDEAVFRLRHEIIAGRHWFDALLDAIGSWRLPSETLDGREYRYLVAGEAFGATRRQLLWKVELPHAMPTIMAGVTQCIMLSLSMVVIAAMVGAPGLGIPVLRALNTVNIAKGFEAGLAIVIVAIVLDRVCKQPGGGDRR